MAIAEKGENYPIRESFDNLIVAVPNMHLEREYSALKPEKVEFYDLTPNSLKTLKLPWWPGPI